MKLIIKIFDRIWQIMISTSLVMCMYFVFNHEGYNEIPLVIKCMSYGLMFYPMIIVLGLNAEFLINLFKKR